MPQITFAALQKRTRHELITDGRALCMTLSGPMTVRSAERASEKRNPTHKYLRLAAIKHFLHDGWDVVPHGIGVWTIRNTMADLAIARGKRIVLVECLTAGWTYYQNVQRKRRLEECFPVWFVFEDPKEFADCDYRNRVQRLRERCRIFVWSKANGIRQLSGFQPT